MTQTQPTSRLLLPVSVYIAQAFFLFGCAGPTTPLGALWATDSSQIKTGPVSMMASLFEKQKEKAKSAPSIQVRDQVREPASTVASTIPQHLMDQDEPSIQFHPPRQVLHGPSPITVIIEDPTGVKSNYKLIVRHNGLDVTPAFLRQARIAETPREIIIDVPKIRLSPKHEHLIEVIYGSDTNLSAYARLHGPSCRAFDYRSVATTGPFTADPKILNMIHKISKASGYNPSFTTALIAQESAFNPRTVSWARAIGLTQVTPIAEKELAQQFAGFANWPRYPGANEMSLAWLKVLISRGKVNASNEWRLNPEQSIQGGLAFLHLLAERWSTPENLLMIQKIFEDPESEQTKLILASYNSGYARVLAALNRRGANWMTAPELREARRYVNRIFSYCDHFAEPEVSNEDKT